MKIALGEKVWNYVLLSFGALIMALPFYYLAITSFKPNEEVSLPTPSMVVHHPTLKPLQELLSNPLVYNATKNSLIIATLQTLGALFFCTLAGYAFAKHRFPGKNLLFLILLSTMMIPGAVLLVPSFLLYRDLGWLDTWAPLIVPGLGGAFGVFLARQFIQKIPDSLIECARLEGCSEPRIYFKMVLPLSKPLLATLGILTFLGSWNSFLGPLIILLNEKLYTLPLVVSMLQGRFPGQDNMQMAGALISIVPVLILFFFFQRQIIQSLAASGMKES
jgi:multiple sugar transport system permease protein